MFDLPWPATVHLLAARALDDTPAQADEPAPADLLRAAAEERSPDAEERNRAVAELAALMSARPARAATLGAVLQAVLATAAPMAQVPQE